jgi:hypothetical protein
MRRTQRARMTAGRLLTRSTPRGKNQGREAKGKKEIVI